MRRSPRLLAFILSVGILPLPALAKIQWKLQFQGEIVSADRYAVRVRTADDKIIEIPMGDMPAGMDLHVGSRIRFITPQMLTRTPSGDLVPANRNAQQKERLQTIQFHGDIPGHVPPPPAAHGDNPREIESAPADAANANRPGGALADPNMQPQDPQNPYVNPPNGGY